MQRQVCPHQAATMVADKLPTCGIGSEKLWQFLNSGVGNGRREMLRSAVQRGSA
jgi:hypothetical protein